MLQTFIIALREGLEMFLIVAVMVAFLKRNNKTQLITPIYMGSVTALLPCVYVGFFMNDISMTPTIEGVLALVAAVMVASLTFMMMRASSMIRNSIDSRMLSIIEDSSLSVWLGLWFFALLMVGREGLEAALMVAALTPSLGVVPAVGGMMLGFLCVIVLGVIWIKNSHLINLGLFLRVTGVFLLLFCLQLTLTAFHEFSEAGIIPFINNEYWHIVTEPYMPDQTIGFVLSCMLLVVPAIFIISSALRKKLLESNKIAVRHP